MDAHPTKMGNRSRRPAHCVDFASAIFGFNDSANILPTCLASSIQKQIFSLHHRGLNNDLNRINATAAPHICQNPLLHILGNLPPSPRCCRREWINRLNGHYHLFISSSNDRHGPTDDTRWFDKLSHPPLCTDKCNSSTQEKQARPDFLGYSIANASADMGTTFAQPHEDDTRKPARMNKAWESSSAAFPATVSHSARPPLLCAGWCVVRPGPESFAE